MRSANVTESEMFSYRTLEQRIPTFHPLRKLRAVVDGILATLHADFEALYAKPWARNQSTPSSVASSISSVSSVL